jgi:ABC-type antimicrobial peptide transport system permease subunit
MREFGIRIALGAGRGDLLHAAFRRLTAITLLGSVAGILLGVLGGRALSAVVYGVKSSDPLVLLLTAVAVASVDCAAVAVPARRALRVDPARLLRSE